MKKFNHLLHVERYIHWQISPKEHVVLFKNGNRFLLSHSKQDHLSSVVFDINDGEAEVIEVEGINKNTFNFDIFYSNIQSITQGIDGILI